MASRYIGSRLVDRSFAIVTSILTAARVCRGARESVATVESQAVHGYRFTYSIYLFIY